MLKLKATLKQISKMRKELLAKNRYSQTGQIRQTMEQQMQAYKINMEKETVEDIKEAEKEMISFCQNQRLMKKSQDRKGETII